MIIAIDGPSGTGKTTVARRVAERLHFSYFDTGAMYRALTWLVLSRGVDPSDDHAVVALIPSFALRIEGQGNEKRYFVGKQEVTTEIRSHQVTQAVSIVAALRPVREALWKIQHAFAQQGNAVFEGRDIGSVVFPEAEVKIFLTARPEVRAQRRLEEIVAKNPQEAKGMDRDKMRVELMRRDELDSTRAVAPLRCPPDAHVVDTSDLSIDEVVELILTKVRH